MTKEEIKEAIASTIVENGQKGITATALANLLNEIVDAAGSGGGSSSGTGGVIGVNMDVDPDTDSIFGFLPNEERAAAYQTIIDCLMENKPCSVTFYGAGTSILSNTVQLGERENGDIYITLVLCLDYNFVFNFELNSDGSMYPTEDIE